MAKWDNYTPRVVENTRKILSLLDTHNVKATFFVLGWVAEKFPSLVQEIDAQGHEIGCHSYYHRLVYDLTPEEFREDTKKSKDLLEQITGKKVKGYRAPSYSITKKSLWALYVLEELGFEYDSSIFPIYHDRYGIPDVPRYSFQWDLSQKQPQYVIDTTSKLINQSTNKPITKITEYPISTSLILGRKIPVAGGGYFRLFPYWFTSMALKRINNKEQQPFIFYLHPWEVDPQQPRFNSAGAVLRFRHYNNLTKTSERFAKLLKDFSLGPICQKT